MPRIFDNIEQKLLDALQETLKVSERADFCVGYFNLRGWRYIDRLMENWQGGANGCCRLLIGMHETPEGELRKVFSLRGMQDVDQSTVVRLKTRIAQEFREQLLMGAPSNADQEGLRRLSAQLRAKRVIVKLFLHHKLVLQPHFIRCLQSWTRFIRRGKLEAVREVRQRVAPCT